MTGGYTESGIGFSNQTTSQEAAETISTAACRAQVEALFQKYGPMADFELRELCRGELEWPLNRRINPRRNELSNIGVLRDSGIKRINPKSNKSCIVWEITPADERDAHKVVPKRHMKLDHDWLEQAIESSGRHFMEVKPCPERCGYEIEDLPESLEPTRPCSTCGCKGWVIK